MVILAFDLFDFIGPHIEYAVYACIAILLVTFVCFYAIPAIRLERELKRVDLKIKGYKKDQHDSDVSSLDAIDSMFENTRLQEAWIEYRKTLHREVLNTGVADDFGSSQGIRYRATVLAETYYTDTGIVDLNVNAEFFRHAPGIFTGFGIIGTFIGLIFGLGNFSISDSMDPHQAQDQLRNLIHAVSGAFHASAAAIIVAIATTCFEKFYVNQLYTRLGSVRDTLDSLFKVGVGEEYLQALKQSSETSQTQMLQVKDKLMEELRPFLQELAEQQFTRSNEQNAMMPGVLATALKESLGEPLRQIAGSVQGVTSDQSDHVKNLLTDVLSGFSAKMQDVFGHQFTDMLNKTTDAMERVARDFSGLADRMGSQGDQVVSSMGTQLTQVIDQMDARQREMSSAMEQFVVELRRSVSESNSESQGQLQTMITSLQGQVSEVLAQVSQSSQQAIAEQGNLQQQLHQQSTIAMQAVQGQMSEALDKIHQSTQATFDNQAGAQAQWQQKAVELLDGLNVQVQASVAATNQMTSAVKESISQLTGVMTNAMRSLELSSGNLKVGIDGLDKSASNVTNAMREGERFAPQLEFVANQFTTSLETTRSIVTNYQEARLHFAESMNGLSEIIENAKREAAMTHAQIETMERSSRLLNEAQTKISDYVAQVSQVLGETHREFVANIGKTIGDVNAQFTQSLTSAVNKVSGTVSELSDTLDKVDFTRLRG